MSEDLRPEIFSANYRITREGLFIDSQAIRNILDSLSKVKDLTSEEFLSSDLFKEWSEVLARFQNKYVMKTRGGQIDLKAGFEEVLDNINRNMENWPHN